MSQSFKTPIVLELNFSFTLIVVLLLSHIGSIICLLVIPVSFTIKIILTLIVIASAVRAICRYAVLITPDAVVSILVSDDECAITRCSGESEAVELQSSGCISVLSLIVLKMKLESKCILIPIFRDMLEPNLFRRLRVHLKLNQT